MDFAIHFLTKFREFARQPGGLAPANQAVFGETARAIWRNAIVITLTFLPLVFATLTPYVTVGLFFAALMIFSAVATLLFLPALIVVFGRWLPLAPKPKRSKAAAQQPVGC